MEYKSRRVVVVVKLRMDLTFDLSCETIIKALTGALLASTAGLGWEWSRKPKPKRKPRFDYQGGRVVCLKKNSRNVILAENKM